MSAAGGVPVQEREVELSHGRSRVLEAGEGPPVLLLHGVGFAPAADGWRPMLQALGARHRVLAPDLLGWGPGDQLEQGYSFAYLVDFVRELQDTLGLRRCDVVGHSMGGWLASVLAYESPERVGRLVLVASGGLLTRPLPQMAAWTPPDGQAIDAALASLAGTGAPLDELAERWRALARDEARTARFRQIMAHMSDGETRVRYNTVRRLPKVASPTLVVWGTNDEVNPVAMARRTVELLARGELRLVEGAGHNLPVERPDELREAVGAFLAEGAPGSGSRRRRSINFGGPTHGAPIPIGSRVGDLVWSSGIFGTEPDGTAPPEPRAQVARMFANLRQFLQAAGTSPEDVVRATVYVRDREVRPLLNEEWVAMFPDESSRPARHVVEHQLPGELLVQIEVVAVAPSEA
jgi:pimeloyl-ACP methyl ester carboxylesterase/enamine deaminase RidA (YjgF/YER057c/UK114 family)